LRAGRERRAEGRVPADRAETLASEAAHLPAVRLDGRALADARVLVDGYRAASKG
jgi:hypothetical protein